MMPVARNRRILLSATLVILPTGEEYRRVVSLTAESSNDRTRENSCCAQLAASADRDGDRALKAQPSSLFLYRLPTSRCDKQPSPVRHCRQSVPGPERSSRDTETSGPMVGRRRVDLQAAPRAAR